VFYLAPDLAAPSGGTRVIYRHVDLLNAAGVEAAVVHQRRGFRCDWFPNSTPVVAAGQVTLAPADVIVVPEWYAAGLHRLPAGVRKVVFNQGPYHTFDGVDFAATGPGAPYTAVPNLVAPVTAPSHRSTVQRSASPTY